VEEFSLFSGAVSGRLASTIASCEAIAARAEQHGYTLVLARCLGRLALCQLDALVDPEQVLKVTQRIRTLTSGLRCAVGMHQVLALRAEIEALFRLGRIREACAVADELETWRQNSGVPALATVSIETRLWTATHDLEKLDALAAGLRSCELPALRGICTAYADFVTGVRAYASDDDLSFAIACLERAEAQAARWPFLVRDVLLYRNYAHASAGHEALGRHALRAAQRHADTYPAPWFAAHLRRIEGGLVAARGLWNEGKQLLQSACATFDLAKDRTDAAYTRYLMYSIANVAAPPDAESIEGLRAARAEFAELGLPEPRGIRAGVARFSAQRQSEQLAHTDTGVHVSERLVVPFQRVAMRGAAPDLILSELLSVVAELVPGRAVRLEEIGPMGEVRCLSGAGLADMPALDDPEWAEFSDGTGRLLRVGVQGALASRERATLTLLTLVAAQALEVAMLRGAGERTPLAAEAPALELPGFIAASSQMRSLRAELRRIASSRATVIITGESGTGKEIVARALHDLSERADKPYVAFNCATVPRELFEGQLFGYRRGSFTGAAFDHPGVIRAANGGTLFLDEIGELPLDIQPKLLRFLENSEVFPLGERAPVRVDVRVVAATHRDLSALIRSGGFREDLYYRLQVVPVFIPPLRERRDDIAVLARHFLRELTRRGEPPVLAPDAVSALLAQSYQGNVRELKNIIERALAYFPDQPVLQAEHLRLSRARGVSPSPTR
jgi:transcriptional regulator with AAA-type ATPase domain